jgi:small subunit ribosomal protein S16
VKIRLMRAGARRRPFYRVVVADSRSPRDGRFIETLGYYDPLPERTVLKIDAERAEYWIQKGAIASDTVRSLIKRAGTLPTADQVAETARQRRQSAIESAAKSVPAARPAEEPAEKEPVRGGKPASEARPARAKPGAAKARESAAATAPGDGGQQSEAPSAGGAPGETTESER